MTTLHKFHWFWIWDDEKEENWLREMSNQGWHFQSASFLFNYRFTRGEPKDYAYRLDYLFDQKDIKNYLTLFQDAGWEHLGEMSNWQYFRKEAREDENPEIYTDNESKMKKYQRVLFILVVLLPTFIAVLNNLNKQTEPFLEIATFFMFCLLILFAYAILKLGSRINRLKRKL